MTAKRTTKSQRQEAIAKLLLEFINAEIEQDWPKAIASRLTDKDGPFHHDEYDRLRAEAESTCRKALLGAAEAIGHGRHLTVAEQALREIVGAVVDDRIHTWAKLFAHLLATVDLEDADAQDNALARAKSWQL